MNSGFTSWYTDERRSGFRQAGLWRDLVLADYADRNLQRVPDRMCVADGRRELSFAEVHRASSSLAEHLRTMGVGPGVAVVVQLPNWWEAVVAYHAVALAGGIMVPRMPIYREAEVLDAADRTGAVVLIVPSTYRRYDYVPMARAVRERSRTVREVIVVEPGPDAPDVLDFGSLLDGRPYSGPKASADDIHTVVFTSGTTAAPKGCAHTVNTLYTPAIVDWELFQIADDDVFFMPTSIMHTSGLVHGVVGPLLYGIPVVLQDIWEPHDGLRRVRGYGCTAAMGATPFLKEMADTNDPAVDGLTPLRLFASGGAPMPSSVVRHVAERLGCTVVGAFGQSESPIITTTRITDDIERIAASDGRPTAICEVTVRDPSGHEVPFGAEGEICSRGAQVMVGYWRDPAETAATIDDEGWCHSGDLGRMQASGDLRVTGRIKDIIVRGGHNLSALEIEDYLLEDPRIRDVAVVGYPDERMGEKVCAFVVTSGGETLSLQDIVEPLKRKGIQMQKLPEHCVVVNELPRSIVGKVNKVALRARAERETAPAS
jgi:non-ribosomal peptide synthetase component E (peptide arylation enzyme)